MNRELQNLLVEGLRHSESEPDAKGRDTIRMFSLLCTHYWACSMRKPEFNICI